jgi:phosphoribosylformimino-5-aminoimidazole carboxamide ribotide isomerase
MPRRREVLKFAAASLTLLVSRVGAGAAPGSSILAVRVWPARDYTRVTLEHDQAIRYSHLLVKDPDRLVLDLSCRKRDGRYWVVTDRWQKFTDLEVDSATCSRLAGFCSEFLVHAVDVEGLCRGIDVDLVRDLAAWSPIPATYAGGAHTIEDLRTVHEVGAGRIGLTIGSALDIFGGTGVRYADCVAFNQAHRKSP